MDVPSWNTIDRPTLEAAALAWSQGEAPDETRIVEIVGSVLEPETVRASLARLIAAGLLSGTPHWRVAGGDARTRGRHLHHEQKLAALSAV